MTKCQKHYSVELIHRIEIYHPNSTADYQNKSFGGLMKSGQLYQTEVISQVQRGYSPGHNLEVHYSTELMEKIICIKMYGLPEVRQVRAESIMT